MLSGLLLPIVFAAGAAYAQPQRADVQPAIDSLVALLPSQEGEARWNTYDQLERLYFTTRQQEKHCELLRNYTAEAAEQKDIDKEAHGRVYLIVSYYNYHCQDSLETNIPSALDFLKKHELWKDYFYVVEAKCHNLLACTKVDEALECASEMYEFAEQIDYKRGRATMLTLLGNVYHAMNRWMESVDSYKEAIKAYAGLDVDWPTLAVVYNGLLSILCERDPEQALDICRESEKRTIEFEKESARNGKHIRTENLWLYINLRYGKAYISLGEYDKAAEYLEKAERNPIANDPMVRSEILYNKAYLLSQQKKYKEALAALLQMQQLNRSQPDGSMNDMSSLRNIAEVAYLAGEFNIAADSYKELGVMGDSVRRREYMAQIDELRTVYEVDKLTAEKRQAHLKAMIALAVCGMLAVMLSIYIIYSGKLRRKNISIYNRIKENSLTESKAGRVLEQIPETKLSKEMKLFIDLNKIMQDEKLFTDSEIDRKNLAVRMGTNEKYLADAVREGAGTTLSSYIADLRLSYSLVLLSEYPELPLRAIAVESGHGSYSPFFRAFIRKYGMSPSEYRNLSRQNSGDLNVCLADNSLGNA